MPRPVNAPSAGATQAALQFVQLLVNGSRPKMEHFLSRVPSAERASLFESLLTAEINARKSNQETPTANDYLGRFPQYQGLIISVLGPPKEVATPEQTPLEIPVAPMPTIAPQQIQQVPVAPLPTGVGIMPVAMPMYPLEPRANAFAFGEIPDAPPTPNPMGEWEDQQTKRLGWLIGLGFVVIVAIGGATAFALIPELRPSPTPEPTPPEVVENTTPETKPVPTKVESKDFDMGGPKSTGNPERDLLDWLREMGASGMVLSEQGGRIRYVPGQNMPNVNKFTVETIILNAEIANRWNNRSIARLSELKDLRKLSLYKDKDLTDDTLAPLVNTAKLKTLELRGTNLQISGEGVARFPELETLVINTSPGFNEADCSALTKLQNLTSLELNGTKITANGFKHFTKLPKLKTLVFGNDLTLSPDHIRVLQSVPLEEIRSENGLADDIFAEFAIFPNMKSYVLRKTTINSSGFKAVAGQVNLQEIIIVGSGITGDGLKHLGELQSLTTLDLSGAKIEGDGLKVLSQLSSLKSIRLAGNPLTDKDVALLAPVETMEVLDLSNTKITDGALGALKKHQKLKRLIVRGTQVTPGGIKDFTMGTPQCAVEK